MGGIHNGLIQDYQLTNGTGVILAGTYTPAEFAIEWNHAVQTTKWSGVNYDMGFEMIYDVGLRKMTVRVTHMPWSVDPWGINLNIPSNTFPVDMNASPDMAYHAVGFYFTDGEIKSIMVDIFN